jgi:TonB-linked SusC/RagA family outer membrane protein
MQFSFAQEKTVTGVVSDKTGPLPGANVVVKGTSTSTQTDFDGKFSIKAKVGAVLEISFTGYSNKTVAVGTANSYNVVLSEGVELQEVVVVGYGTTTKERFTGTASKVNIENIEAKTVSNVSQALRGEVAGVTIVSRSGAPGSDADIRIRGFGSINGNSDPLIVIDGAPYTSDLTSINPADIEAMTVLKDAAATSIYGSRGANGVVLITTKQGKVGKSVISVDFKTSINTLSLPGYDAMTSPEQYIQTAWSSLRTKAYMNGEANPAAWASANLYGTSTEAIDPHYNIWNVDGASLIDPVTGKIASGVARKYNPTKWADAAFDTGYRSEANVQFSGGNDKTRYALSFGYLDEKGYAIKSNYTRYTTRLNLENKIKDWMKIGASMAYTGSKYTNTTSDEGTSGSSGNLFALVSNTPAIYDVYLRDNSGNLVADPYYGGYQFDYGNSPYNRRSWNGTNAIADATYDLSQTLGNTILGNFNINIDLNKNLTFETRYSGQYQNFDSANRNNPFYGSSAADFGYLSKTISTSTNQNFLQLLRFSKAFGKHNIETFAAHESTDYQLKYFNAQATHAIMINTIDLAQYTTPYSRPTSYTRGYTLESYFAQFNYDYGKKYYLTTSARRDGSSRFKYGKWGTFGSIGLGWVVSKEDFMSKLDFVDYFKLKASYGEIGDPGNNYQNGWQLVGINQTASGDYSFTASSNKENPYITWETSKISQIGFESSWFNNRLDVNVDVYNKLTSNLYFDQAQAPSSGFNTMSINSGKMQNRGIEFEVVAHVVKPKSQGGLKLDLAVNGEMLHNEVLQMPANPFTGERRFFDSSLSLAKGYSIYDWYMREWAGVDPANGDALWNLYYDDINNDGMFNAGDVQITNLQPYLQFHPNPNLKKTVTSNYAQATEKFVGKSAIPKIRGAFRLNAAYKNFDFTAQVGYSIGGYVYDSGYAQLMDSSDLIGTNNWHTDILSAWKQPGDITDVPKLTSSLGPDSNYASRSTRFLTKADYLSLNNLSIGYSLPETFLSKMKLSKVNLFLSGDNLLMFSARKGLNPTTMIATNNSGIYMPMTTYSFGAKVEF